MKWDYHQILKIFSKKNNYLLFGESMHGLERECLRIDHKGLLSKKSHPSALGEALKNPLITTDFSESQLELISPPQNTEGKTAGYLKNVHIFMAQRLDREFFWPFSMPCRLPKNADEIHLADYGNSFDGRKKMKYRLGLSHRYGRKMQTVSGTHYNFSFSENFWKFLHENSPALTGRQKRATLSSLQDFISEKYLHIVRNFLRYSWINTYLFGAAPVIDESYLTNGSFFNFSRPQYLKKLDSHTYYAEYACSFRMSELGYYSKVQAQHAISFNNLNEYLHDLKHAISTPESKYKNFPGINDHVLQMEAEHYSRIRPKQILQIKPGPLHQKETPLEALNKRGIAYVEARAIDINPYSPIGLDIDQLEFLHVFLVYCLFKSSPKIQKSEHCIITGNQNKVSIFGRKPGLALIHNGKEIAMQIWARKILHEMKAIAELLNKNSLDNNHQNSLIAQIEKLEKPYLTPSARIISKLTKHKKSFLKYGIELAKKHCNYFEKEKLPETINKKFQKIAFDSIQKQKNQEIIDDTFTEGYEDLEVSTQILIKEALKRKIRVEALDRPASFIRLSKDSKIEYVKQATKTSKDSYATFLIMENKNVTNQILKAGGLRVPEDEAFTDSEAAISAYGKFKKIKCVIKPTTTNHGIGISFIEPNNEKDYKKAIIEAFKHAESILIEEFIEGEEYRILVIDYKTQSIVKRIPAHVIGDGVHNIRQLVKFKNEDPRNYRFFYDDTIKTGNIEKNCLKTQGFTFASILAKGKQVFLRFNSNVGTGGDPIECSQEVHESYKRLAERAAKTVKAKICGVDMIIQNHEKKAQENVKNKPVNYAIIELNFNPSLQMHHFPVKGQRVNVAGKVLDLLGF